MTMRGVVRRVISGGRGRAYVAASCGVLLGTTVAWAWAAARVQQGNADQLVDGFLFTDWQTLHGAIFPSAHTQLLKWPLFWVLARLHFSAGAYASLTVLVTLATVAGLGYLLYQIDRRPFVFGTLCLLLAAVLLLVPVDVFDQAVTTPLSFAMLTGRNIEYLLFVGVLAAYARAARWRSWQFGVATLGYALLVASDRLFLYYGVGGAVVCALVGWLPGRQQLFDVARRWLAGSLVAWAAAGLILAVIGHSVTHITDYALGVQTVHSAYAIWQGSWNAVHAVGLQFGLTVRAGWLTIPAVVVNCVTAGLAVYAAGRLFGRAYKTRGQNPAPLSVAQLLSVMLLASTCTAFALFALTNQSELGNARYETIALITGFVVLATWARGRRWSWQWLFVTGCVAMLAVSVACAGVLQHTYGLTDTALQTRNKRIAAALQSHHVTYLAGNYWRVFPVTLLTLHAGQTVVPFWGCFQPTPTLTSSVWRPDLRLHSFAYIATEEFSGVPGQPCRKKLIVHEYGTPTATLRIAGSSVHPTEELLFYDDGAADPRHLIPQLP